MSDLILYTSEDGKTRMDLRSDGKTIWLTQREMAELFSVSQDNIGLHLKNLYEEAELSREATTEESSVVQMEGKREVRRPLTLYNLDAILTVGYRVRSPRGVQFRQWATAHLKEFLVKGFLIDDERMKNPEGWDHFDELLARIREIRASEFRFYQKVRELFALSSDYKVREKETQRFFAEVQNKLLYAATGNTAAELVVERADAAKPNMALTHFEGSRVRKADVIIAKNYLTEDEIDTLNRLVVIFLEQAELRVKTQKDLTLDFWRGNVDGMLEFNAQIVLKGSGEVSHEGMKAIVHERYEEFDHKRRVATAEHVDAEDLKEIEELENKLKKKKP
jgi:hypothetical protein